MWRWGAEKLGTCIVYIVYTKYENAFTPVRSFFYWKVIM